MPSLNAGRRLESMASWEKDLMPPLVEPAFGVIRDASDSI